MPVIIQGVKGPLSTLIGLDDITDPPQLLMVLYPDIESEKCRKLKMLLKHLTYQAT